MTVEYKIPTPEDVVPNPEAIHHRRVQALINAFVACVEQGNFHYTSTDEKKVVMLPYESPHSTPEVCEDAVRLLREKGWSVKYALGYCGHGPFKSIEWTP